MSVRSASFPLEEECYHALVEYKYAGKGVPDHWSQFWHRQGHRAGISPDGSNGGPVARTLLRFLSSRFGSPEKGAQTPLYLASSPEVETITGKYFVKSVPRRSSTLSYDESHQRQLWEESAKLVNLPATMLAW